MPVIVEGAAWKDRTSGNLEMSLLVKLLLWGDKGPQYLPEPRPAQSARPFWLTWLLSLPFLHAEGPLLIAEFLPTKKHGVNAHSDGCCAYEADSAARKAGGDIHRHSRQGLRSPCTCHGHTTAQNRCVPVCSAILNQK